jgi:hypothetical protein
MTLANFMIYILPAMFLVVLWAIVVWRILNNRKLNVLQKSSEELLSVNKEILRKLNEVLETTGNRKP